MIGFGYHDTMETSRALFEDLPSLQVLKGHQRVTMVPPEERVIPSKEMYL